jgi:hypothetical protein
MLYTPPIHVLPGESAPATLVTETRAISMTEPAKSAIVTSYIDTYQLVSTPAGVFGAWRVDLLVSGGTDIRHGLGARQWFAVEVGTIQWIDEGFSAQLRTSSRLDP